MIVPDGETTPRREKQPFESIEARWRFALSALLCLIALFCVVLALSRLLPRTTWDKLDRIGPGMTESEVVEQLGHPFQKHTRQDDKTDWAYPNGFHDPSIVTFDANGRVVEVR